MNIKSEWFGTTLLSRQTGREAYNDFRSNLELIKDDEEIIIILDGVITFPPGWGDEFLTPIIKQFGDRMKLKKTTNPSVLATLRILTEIHKIKFNII